MHYENEESGKIRKLMEKAAAEQNFRYDKGEIAFAVIVYHGFEASKLWLDDSFK